MFSSDYLGQRMWRRGGHAAAPGKCGGCDAGASRCSAPAPLHPGTSAVRGIPDAPAMWSTGPPLALCGRRPCRLGRLWRAVDFAGNICDLALLRAGRCGCKSGHRDHFAQENDVCARTTEIRVNSWEQFEQEIAKLEAPGRPRWDELWFRGQANANWGLDTTLERRYGPSHAVGAYLRLINRIKPAVETFTEASFVTPTTSQIQEGAHSYDLFHNFILSGITYMAHLRHNGFPSPLLDWSSSPYVAGFFAFARAIPGTDVAVFVFRERPNNFKLGGSDSPSIFSVGPILKTHKRHFRQQSRYTICAKFEARNEWVFANHGTVFRMPDRDQDLLWTGESHLECS